jgi:hypothetical protein
MISSEKLQVRITVGDEMELSLHFLAQEWALIGGVKEELENINSSFFSCLKHLLE